MTPARRKFVYAVSFEALGTLLASVALMLMSEASASSSLVLSLLTATIAIPAAWAATLGRSVLAGIGTAIGILVVSQVAVVAGTGGWFTFAAPALWAVSQGTRVSPTQLALIIPLVLGSCSLILVAWSRLQLDK